MTGQAIQHTVKRKTLFPVSSTLQIVSALYNINEVNKTVEKVKSLRLHIS